MFPQKGDIVKFTDDFLNDSPPSWTSTYKGINLEVISIKLQTMVPMGIFVVYVMENSVMNKIRIDRQGRFVDDFGGNQHPVVFEDAFGHTVASASAPPPGASAGASSPPAPSRWTIGPKPGTNEDDRCKQCGTMGVIRGMSCTCPSCGNVIWGA